MARESVAGLDDDALVHGRRHERVGLPAHAKPRAGAQHLEDVVGVGRVDAARGDRRARRHGHDLNRARLMASRRPGVGQRLERDVHAEPGRALGEHVGVAEHGEAAGVLLRGERDADVRPDTGRLAARERDERQRGAQFRPLGSPCRRSRALRRCAIRLRSPASLRGACRRRPGRAVDGATSRALPAPCSRGSAVGTRGACAPRSRRGGACR